MQKLSTLFRNASIAAVGTAVAVPAFAIDTAAVGAAIDAATDQAGDIGQFVVAGVAALVVIGIAIAIIRKV